METNKATEMTEYKKCFDAVQECQRELQERSSRNDEIEFRLLNQPKPTDQSSVWKAFLSPGAEYQTSNENELREELRFGRERESFLAQAIEEGKLELDRLHGAASREACLKVRAKYVAQIRRILALLKEFCAAEDELQRIRHEIEASGYRSDSLPSGLLGLGAWDDAPFGGSRVSAYRRAVAENFPELGKV